MSAREERERTFWQSFILWYFKVWPQFYSPDHEQRKASMDCSRMSLLLSEAKELIYWALDMDRVFVPSLSGRYGDVVDEWRYQYLKKQSRGRLEDEVADGIVGARYFGVPEVDEG